VAELDATMIGQALTNLIKNAGEAIESLQTPEAAPDHKFAPRTPRADAALARRGGDRDPGQWHRPAPDRAKLFEPYVTTREKGTGLGLPIVKKIIEEHGGTLVLEDADLRRHRAHRGARAIVIAAASIADAGCPGRRMTRKT
jgi:two-component system nitrogen regulation sensor histidine kinase NtrY